MPDGLTRSSRPRILVSTDAVGGVWRYAVDLASGLAARGVQTVLAVMGPDATAAQRAEAEAVPGLRLVRTGLPLDWTARDAGALRDAAASLASLAALTGAASVHLHAPALAAGPHWPVPVVAVAHSCVATWWGAVRGGPLPEDFRWRTQATRDGLGVATACIAPTAAHATAVAEAYGSVDIRVVHNGSVPRVSPVGPRRRGVFTAGRLWDEGKNAAALDRAAAAGIPIRAAGPCHGPNGAACHLPHLELLGTLDAGAMAREYAGASVFASLARYEPFGLAVLEAAQAGMRLVLSDIPSFRELWDGAATFVAEEAELVPALQAALEANGDARQHAARYSLDAMADATLAVHQAVLA